MFENATPCYDKLEAVLVFGSGTNVVNVVVEWIDDCGDAAATEAEVDHTLCVMPLETFKLSQSKRDQQPAGGSEALTSSCFESCCFAVPKPWRRCMASVSRRPAAA